MKLLRIAVTALLLVAVGVGCADDPLTPSWTPPPDPLDLTPRDDWHAEMIALALSGQLVAPQDLYEEVRDGLDSLQSQYDDAIPELRTIWFRPCWMPGEIAGSLTEAATTEMRAGTYTDMDSLNAALRLARMDTTSFPFRPNQIYFELLFEGFLHPYRLVEIYEALPSVAYAGPGYACWDGSAMYPHLIEGGVSYLFRRGWGDCPSGCIYSEFWYFRVVDARVEYVGHWDPTVDPQPDWWIEARRAFCEERGGGRYCGD